jgi:hypothetical protein
MSTTDTLYTARFLSPEWLERGRDNVIKCSVYRDGALAAPSSGTVSIFNASDVAVVTAAAVTVSGDVAQYSVANATLSAELLGAGWLVEWSLTMPDGVDHIFRTDGGMVRRRLYPVVTDDDLTRRHSDLADLRPSSLTSYQQYLDEAWAEIENRLIGDGNRPYLVVNPHAFREVHLFKTLELIFTDFHMSAGEGKWLEMANQYGKLYGIGWHRISMSYDADDDGFADSKDSRRAARPTIWLSGRG